VGQDIDGSIECRLNWGSDEPTLSRAWQHAVDLLTIYGGGDYDAFGCLFGVRNYAGFEAVAGGRGIPADASPETTAEAKRWPSASASWVSWAEIEAIDWRELATHPDPHYFRADNGDWRLVSDKELGQDPGAANG
jgi:hypothetical protein